MSGCAPPLELAQSPLVALRAGALVTFLPFAWHHMDLTVHAVDIQLGSAQEGIW